MRKELFLLMCLLFPGCIGTDVLDDAVMPEVVILNPVTSIEVGTTYKFMAEYRNMTGNKEDVPLTWTSTQPDIIEISSDGLATAVSAGESLITVIAEGIEVSIAVEAGETTSGQVTERSAALQTSSSYPLSGSASLIIGETGLELHLGDDFQTTSALPGLYVYLSNNTSTTNNAYEIGKVERFSGAQQYVLNDLSAADLMSYRYVLFFCKPFVVPVGHGELTP